MGFSNQNMMLPAMMGFSFQNVRLGPNSLEISLLEIAYMSRTAKNSCFTIPAHIGKGAVVILLTIVLIESTFNIQIWTDNYIFATPIPKRIGMGISLTLPWR